MTEPPKEFLTTGIIEHSLVNVPQITFEVTDACNLNCTYCGYGDFYSDHDARNGIMLPIGKAKALIDYLSGMWNSAENVSFNRNIYVSFYGGEPLLNMQFITEIVDHFKCMNCRSRSFTFSMTTNGLLLHKYIDYLAENKFHTLVSLDGDREANDYRVDKSGKPAFDRIVANVNMVKKNYPEYFMNS